MWKEQIIHLFSLHLLELSTEAQPVTLTNPIQLLRVPQADGERPKPKSEVPAPTGIKSCSTIGVMQGSVSSYTPSAQTQQCKTRLGVTGHVFPFSKQKSMAY